MSFSLISESLGTGLLRLGHVDVLHQDTLVLEDVTFRLHVQIVVQVLIDLTGFTILAKQSPQDALTPHPEHGNGHTRVSGTTPFASTHMATLPLRFQHLPYATAAVHRRRLADNEAVFHQTAHGLARVRRRNVAGLVRVEPDLAFAALENGSSQTLLKTEVRPINK